MKRTLIYTILTIISLLTFDSVMNSQTYTVGVPVNKLIGTFGQQGPQFCYPASVVNDTFPFCHVTGLQYIWVCDSVTIANSIYASPGNKIINLGDTLFITPSWHNFSLYYPSGGYVRFKIYTIGTPQVAGQTYPCGQLGCLDPLLQCNDDLYWGFTNCTATVAVGIESIIHPQTLKIYPNPSNGSFTLHVDNTNDNAQVVLVNTLGQKVLQQKILQADNNIDATGLSKGLYSVILYSRQVTSIGRLVIE